MSVLYVKFDGSYLQKKELSAAACVVYQKGETPLVIRTRQLSVRRSGEAEQYGLVLALDTLLEELPRLEKELGEVKTVRIYGDSQVVFRHVRQTSVCKSRRTKHLAQLSIRGVDLLKRKGIDVEMYWVPRKCNLLADTLCRTVYCFKPQVYTHPSYLKQRAKQRIKRIPSLICRPTNLASLS